MKKTNKQTTIKPLPFKTRGKIGDKIVPLVSRFQTFRVNHFGTKKRSIFSYIVLILALLAVLFAIPVTRYSILSSVVKKEVVVTVVDSKTKQPVSNAKVFIKDVSGQTDKDGRVILKNVPVGQDGIIVSKQYYNDNTVAFTVPIFTNPHQETIEIVATGRMVTVGVMDKISGSPVADVVLKYGETEATTNDKGEAILIVEPNRDTQRISINRDGYNSQDVEVKSSESKLQSFTITPVGSIYFLSKASGKIDVVKSRLDGTKTEVVISGTGQEIDSETSLLSSRDWSYAALSSTRDDNPGLYLWDSAKGDLSVIDKGSANFELVGWSGHNFIYTVYRNTANYWDDKRLALKSFNADTRKITTIDESSGGGLSSYYYAYEYFTSVYILKDEVVYAKNWLASYASLIKPANLISANPQNGNKKTVSTFAEASINTRLYEPQELYVSVTDSTATHYFEYENKILEKVTTINSNKFNAFYPTYLISPSDKKTFWYEPRNGKNTLFIGDENGKNQTTVAELSEYVPYGWYGENDEYILLSKGGSELYIAPSSKVIGQEGYQPLKISDYHKTRTYAGYGYGYGGQ